MKKLKNMQDKYHLLTICRSSGLPVPVPEYKFCPTRRWRLDYAWIDYKLALEVEGGIWITGRHNYPSGFLKDIEKYNTLTLMGWKLIRCTPSDIKSLRIIATLQDFFSMCQNDTPLLGSFSEERAKPHAATSQKYSLKMLDDKGVNTKKRKNNDDFSSGNNKIKLKNDEIKP